jgi:hypothetical protein
MWRNLILFNLLFQTSKYVRALLRFRRLFTTSLLREGMKLSRIVLLPLSYDYSTLMHLKLCLETHLLNFVLEFFDILKMFFPMVGAYARMS